MPSRLQIVNRGLQRIGAKRLTTLTENTRERLAVEAAYIPIVEQELRINFWTFAIKRVEITANVTAPDFGRANAFDLPADFLRMAPDDPHDNPIPSDLLFEQRQVLSNYSSPLQMRYVQNAVSGLTALGTGTPAIDEANWDVLFANAISMRLAAELAEELTQAAGKIDRVESAYTFFINQARRTNAIESGPIAHEIDELVSVRLSESGDDLARRKYV